MVKPFYVKNLKTGEVMEYKSGYVAMKELGVNSVIIYQNARLQKRMEINGVEYMMSR